jgi:prepilin-type N-terminal cleavage/methylation domain-containing protein
MCRSGQRYRGSSRGFTLIETIAAIVILAVAIPPMMWAVRNARVERVNPQLASRAHWLASDKLEEVIADRHSSTRGYAYLVTANYAAEDPVSGSPGFTRTVAFNETAADLLTAGTGYMTVSVDVGWTDGRGEARTLSVSTVLTEYTP